MKRRILAIFCVLATLLAMVVVPAYAAEDRAADAVTVLTQDMENLVVSGDTYIDLNGFDIAGVTVEDGTLYVSDSKTDDYTVADGIYGSVTGITGDVQAAEGYLAITEGEALSYHKVDLTLKSMTLRPAEAGVYYNSAFAADEVVAAQVDTYGVALSVVGEPTAKNLTTQCGYSAFEGFTSGEKSGTLLSGVMKKDNIDYINNRNANMAIYGRAYICVDGDYVFGACAKRSLKEQVEAIDAVFASLNATQQSAIADMYKTFKSVMSGWNLPNISEASVGVLAGDVEITIPITAEGGKVTEEITVEQDGLTVTIPFGALVESDELTLTVTREEQTDVEAAEGQSLLPLNVHVDGLSAENTVPLTIGLGKVLPKNLNLGNYAAYHTEDSSANEMTLVSNDEPFTAHNQFKYDLEGRITLHVAGFSLFTLRSNNANTWNGDRNYEWYNADAETLYIRNADQLAGFGAIVGGMDGKTADDFTGKNIVLLADITIGDLNSENGYVFYPIGYYNNKGVYSDLAGIAGVSSGFKNFKGTFDGNGNTISDFYQNTWEMEGDYNDGYAANSNYYRDGMGLFGKVYGGTVKNLTVKNFSCDAEHGTTGTIAAYADCAATFENIAIFNCNPRVYNIGNGGIVGCVGWYAKAATTPVIFMNITVDQSNKISALWGTYDASCGGILGQYYPTSGQNSSIKNGGVHFENCHVAAEMDVNNDVCGNYQYYWYRYCGMFIGSTRENTTDNGYTVAYTAGITAENCTYNVGKWNNYYYCELVANTLASYTHDHQMSRLTPVKSVVGTTITPLEGDAYTVPASGRYNYVVVNGEHSTDNATCYHFVDGQVWDHANAGKETVNGVEVLKEDNQHIYLPFNQLLTGYGWGIKAYQKYPGMEPSADALAVSTEKFTAKIPQNINIAENVTSIAVSDLFEAGSNVIPSTTHVYISPVGEDSTVEADYVCVTDGYLENIADLPISGTGKAKITITDYYFCTPTVLYVTVGGETVANVGDYEFVSLQDAMDAVQDGGTVTLLDNVNLTEYLDIHTANFGETARNITLDLADHTIAPAADYKYEWYPLVFVGINQTLTIKGGTIKTNEHTAIGVYGALNLENVVVDGSACVKEEAVCIWNWSENDEYFQDCQYLLTGSATITGGNITGSILAEGTVTFNETAQFDKLYLNTKTGHGKYILPTGYGMVKDKENGYYTNIHKHTDGVCTVCGFSTTYVKTDLADIKSTDTVVITMSKDGNTWALMQTEGKQGTLAAVEVGVKDGVITSAVTGDIQWNVNNTDGELTIYPNGEDKEWLYCTNENTGLHVGTGAAKGFVIDGETGYLVITVNDNERYIGVYNATDWRSYKLDSGKIQSNIAGQTLAFYVLKSNCEHSNKENRDEIAATCVVAGHKAGVYCLDCDTYISGGDLIGAFEHDFVLKTTKEATCTENGKKTFRCSVCNKIKTETIKAAHAWDEGKIVETPTCNNAGSIVYTCGVCEETKTEDIETIAHTEVTDAAVDATCTATGLTEGKHCSVCNEVIVAQTEIPMLPHSFTDGTCEVCGAEDPDYKPTEPSEPEATKSVEVTISFANDDQRVSQDNNSQIWKNEDVTFTNTKTASSSAVVGNVNPVRLYKNSTVTIDAPGNITSIVFNCDSGYKTLPTTLDNATVSVNGNKTTITLTKPVKEFTFTLSAAQVRAFSIVVTYTTTAGGDNEQTCQHTNTKVYGVVEATCIEPGYTGDTICSDCGETVKTGSVIDAKEHSYVDGVCSDCGVQDPSQPGETGFVLKDLSNVQNGDKVVITVVKNNKLYALSSDRGSGNPPVPVEITVENGKISTNNDNIYWIVEVVSDGYKFRKEGTTNQYLYCTNNNNGLRVGTGNSNNIFKIKNNYLYNNAQGRYIGVYLTQDWRSYTSINTNISGQTLGIYVEE